MKKPWFLAGWLMIAAPCLAQNQLDEKQRWIEQADTGFVFPASQAAAADYGAGVGGDVLVGYRFNRDISLSADLGFYQCGERGGAAGGQWVYLPVLLVARYNFGDGWVRPYLILGGGRALNIYSPTFGVNSDNPSQVQFSPLVAPGMGILFVLARDLAVYGQVRFDLDYSNPGGSWPDDPTVFIPVKAGIAVFAL